MKKVASYLEYGRVVLDDQKIRTQRLLNEAYTIYFEGQLVPIVNCPKELMSGVGHELCKKFNSPFSITYRDIDGKRLFSLRGMGLADLSELAKRHGGGGHKDAGCRQVTIRASNLEEAIQEAMKCVLKTPSWLTGVEMYNFIIRLEETQEFHFRTVRYNSMWFGVFRPTSWSHCGRYLHTLSCQLRGDHWDLSERITRNVKDFGSIPTVEYNVRTTDGVEDGRGVSLVDHVGRSVVHELNKQIVLAGGGYVSEDLTISRGVPNYF